MTSVVLIVEAAVDNMVVIDLRVEPAVEQRVQLNTTR